jgi:hypothetical protein
MGIDAEVSGCVVSSGPDFKNEAEILALYNLPSEDELQELTMRQTFALSFSSCGNPSSCYKPGPTYSLPITGKC